MNSDGFYADLLKSFDEFAEVSEISNYQIAPDDWHVIIADVEGSTRAIEEGRYKDVNLIGAACINAVLNINEKDRIPYVFGGDGATLLVPSSCLDSSLKSITGRALPRRLPIPAFVAGRCGRGYPDSRTCIDQGDGG